MPHSFPWADGPGGGTSLSAANLNKLMQVADAGTAGTPTGDALGAAFDAWRVPAVADPNANSGVTKTELITDPFNVIDPAWVMQSGVFSINAGRLSAPIDANYTTGVLNRPADLTGSFIALQVVQSVDPSIVSGQAYFGAAIDTAASQSATFALFPNGSAKAQLKTTATADVAAFTPGTANWFRIREKGGTLYWEIGSGGNWSQVASAAVPAGWNLTAMRLEVGGGRYTSTDPTGTALFDNLNLLP